MKVDELANGFTRAIRWHRRTLAAVAAAICLLATLSALHPPAPRTAPVLVTTRKLNASTPVSGRDVEVRQLPVDAIPEGALTKPNQVVGRALVTRRNAGMVLIDADLAGSGLVSAEQGETLVPFRVNDAAIIGLLRVGDHINVVGHRPDGEIETLAKGVRVAALPPSGTDGGLVTPSANGALIVVAVSPESAPRLAAATSDWRLAVIITGR